MSKFKCKCLNITIHVKEKATREAKGTAFVSENCSESFFTKELYEVELAVGGITKVICSVRFSIRTGNTKGYFKVACIIGDKLQSLGALFPVIPAVLFSIIFASLLNFSSFTVAFPFTAVRKSAP